MKKALLTLLSILTLTAQACWIVIDGYSHAEISGVNYFQPHNSDDG